MSEQVLINADKVEKIYGYGHNSLRVLKNISLEVKKGEILSIVGPSGAGKSTLLNLIGCLDFFQRGKLTVMNRDVSRISIEDLSSFRNKHLGFIFQLHNLLPEFSALENIMIPLLIRRINRNEALERSMELIKRFNLGERAHHKPSQLSGGECQRIAVARAMVTKPDIILADEPTGSLDSKNSELLAEALLKLGEENRATVIIVTHDINIAEMTQRVISLVDGDIIMDRVL